MTSTKAWSSLGTWSDKELRTGVEHCLGHGRLPDALAQWPGLELSLSFPGGWRGSGAASFCICESVVFISSLNKGTFKVLTLILPPFCPFMKSWRPCSHYSVTVWSSLLDSQWNNIHKYLRSLSKKTWWHSPTNCTTYVCIYKQIHKAKQKLHGQLWYFIVLGIKLKEIYQAYYI